MIDTTCDAVRDAVLADVDAAVYAVVDAAARVAVLSDVDFAVRGAVEDAVRDVIRRDYP